MKYKISNQDDNVSITVSNIDKNKEKLLEIFQECKDGTCSCPTSEYDKVDALEISNTSDSIQITIKALKAEEIDSKEIEKCLIHANKQAII